MDQGFGPAQVRESALAFGDGVDGLLGVREQWIALRHQEPKEVFQDAGQSVVGHEPDADPWQETLIWR